jgi:hypothetical protein
METTEHLKKGGAETHAMQKDPPWWKIAIAVPILLFIIFFILGPVTVFLAVFLQRGLSRVSSPWDADRYWEGVKGYAVAGILVYAILVASLALFGPLHQMDLSLAPMAYRLLIEGLDLSTLALLSKWTAGLLFLPALALLQERTAPRTDRSLLRILTPAEQQLLSERETEKKRQAEIRKEAAQAQTDADQKTVPLARPRIMKTSPAKQHVATPEEPDTPLDPTKLDKRTFWERVPDDAPMKQLAREEQERNQFIRDQAQKMGIPRSKSEPSRGPSVTPKPKPQKQDKGDGSMDELL